MQYPGIVRAHIGRLAHGFHLEVADNLSWLVVREFGLPPGWSVPTTSVLLYIPPAYPLEPPGLSSRFPVCLQAELRYRGHRVCDFHDHPESPTGWRRWCYEQIAWNPQRSDLVDLLQRLTLDLSHPHLIEEP